MELEVIGAGFGRTGTMSIMKALIELGYPCHHMMEVFEHNEQAPIFLDALKGIYNSIQNINCIYLIDLN
jgi:hypothetical protein